MTVHKRVLLKTFRHEVVQVDAYVASPVGISRLLDRIEFDTPLVQELLHELKGLNQKFIRADMERH